MLGRTLGVPVKAQLKHCPPPHLPSVLVGTTFNGEAGFWGLGGLS